jgi:hypothetical protein
MKNITNFLAGLFVFSLSFAVLNAQNLYVLENSGQQTSYVIGGINKLHFSSGELFIEMQSGTTDNYLLADLQYLNFTDLLHIPAQIVPATPEMSLYPNPVSGTLHISYLIPGGEKCRLEIISADGRIVRSENLPAGNKMLSWEADLSAIPEGLYLCRVNNGKSMITKKFIKN